MIPERIYVAGFLCYREPQELRFQGCSLWLLAGPNGSGKSALFDAILFALFAQHRGGRQHSRGLINESADRLVVEFDFQLDGLIYRARRTLARSGRSTRQLLRSKTAGPSEQVQWETLADTHRETGYRAWIRNHLGLSYEAFTASVLLLQGRSDQILNTPPAERNDLLAQIVGLEQFRELERRSRSKVTRLDGTSDSLRKQLAGIPKTSAKQLERTGRRTVRLRKETQRLTEQLGKLREQTLRAESRKQDQQRILELQRKRDELRQVLLNAEHVERNFGRWNQLKSHLPILQALVELQRRFEEVRLEIEQSTAAKGKMDRELATVSETIAAGEKRLDDDVRQLEARAVALESLAQSRAECTRIVDSIRRFRTAWRRLRQVEEITRADRAALDEALNIRKQLRETAPSEDTIQDARRAQERATEAVVRTQVLYRQASERLERFCSVSTKEKCSYCQQPLPRGVIENARAKLQSGLRDAESAVSEATRRLSDTDRRLAGLERRRNESLKRVHELDGKIDAYETSRSRTLDLHEEVAQNYEVGIRELPTAIREQIHQNGLANEDVERLLETILKKEGRKQRDLAEKTAELRGELELLGRDAEHSRMLIKSANKKRSVLQAKLQNLQAKIARDEGELQRCRDALVDRHRDLPTAWQPWPAAERAEQLAKLTDEMSSLHSAEIKNQWETLCRAKSNDLRLSIQQETLDASSPGLPSYDSMTLDELSQACNTCQVNLVDYHEQLKASELEEREKEALHARRESLTSELAETQNKGRLWKRLADLLGRDRLQRCLMRNAEREIVDYANVLLDRLSAGPIFLELRGERDDKRKSNSVLDLRARVDSAKGVLLDVAFLSGSQRFRVAISLALAIGQYASHARRPIQAVIIDEGFGCLDATNRQVMIQELHNLRHHLQRILLVSHQEEFADAFSDGYVCKRVNGSTQVTSFHR